MSIEKNMKLAQKFFTVSFIMAVVQISFALFYEFLIKANSTTWSFNYNLFCVILIEIFAPLNGMNTKKDYQKYTIEKKLGNLICILISANPLIVFIFALMSFGFGCFYFLGYTYGLALVFLIIGHIFYVKFFVAIYNEKNSQKNSDKLLDKQQKRLNYLLGKVGSKFFVKYYVQLKNNSVLDVMDIIEELYSEETKKSRINYAKTIFAENLQKLALQQILDDKNTILDEKMQNIAQELLKNEQKNLECNHHLPANDKRAP